VTFSEPVEAIAAAKAEAVEVARRAIGNAEVANYLGEPVLMDFAELARTRSIPARGR